MNTLKKLFFVVLVSLSGLSFGAVSFQEMLLLQQTTFGEE